MSRNPKLSHEERFESLIDRSGECHLWTGRIGANGYGYFDADYKAHLVHRWEWIRVNGPIPAGYEIDHVRDRGCTNKHCVRIEHLEPVTPRENTVRISTTPRQERPFYDHEELHATGAVGRHCRLCSRRRKTAERARKRAKAESQTDGLYRRVATPV